MFRSRLRRVFISLRRVYIAFTSCLGRVYVVFTSPLRRVYIALRRVYIAFTSCLGRVYVVFTSHYVVGEIVMRAPNDRASRSHSTSPLPPLCTPATQASIHHQNHFISVENQSERPLSRSSPELLLLPVMRIR